MKRIILGLLFFFCTYPLKIFSLSGISFSGGYGLSYQSGLIFSYSGKPTDAYCFGVGFVRKSEKFNRVGLDLLYTKFGSYHSVFDPVYANGKLVNVSSESFAQRFSNLNVTSYVEVPISEPWFFKLGTYVNYALIFTSEATSFVDTRTINDFNRYLFGLNCGFGYGQNGCSIAILANFDLFKYERNADNLRPNIYTSWLLFKLGYDLYFWQK